MQPLASLFPFTLKQDKISFCPLLNRTARKSVMISAASGAVQIAPVHQIAEKQKMAIAFMTIPLLLAIVY